MHHFLTYQDRLKIEHMYNKLHLSKILIAGTLGVCRQTVYNELKKGLYERLDTNLRLKKAYSADIAQKKTDYNNQSKGCNIKLSSDYAFSRFISECIVQYKYSPAVALCLAKSKGFSCDICLSTLYNYIDKGYILGVSRSFLPLRKRKKHYRKVVRDRKVNVMYSSIDDRPQFIDSREEFGHWELDTVVGKSRGISSCLMVLTERKTRFEIVSKLPRKTQFCVNKALDNLERVIPSFAKVFKTITCDNGCEFSPWAIENSVFGGKRTSAYFCHPYSSFERGSNENANKLIRRHFPKGYNFDSVSDFEVLKVQNWINGMPRKLLNWQTSEALYKAEISCL